MIHYVPPNTKAYCDMTGAYKKADACTIWDAYKNPSYKK